MIKINSEQFDSEIKNGIFIFVINDCFLCREYIRELKKSGADTRKWYMINCEYDEDYYLEMQHINDLPVTRIYKDNVIMWQKDGVLYNKQLKELLEYKQI